MLVLFRNQFCPIADRVQERLEDLVVAHRVVVVERAEPGQKIPSELPAIQHSSGVVQGEENLQVYLVRLEQVMADWNRFQSDSCYLDDDGTVC